MAEVNDLAEMNDAAEVDDVAEVNDVAEVAEVTESRRFRWLQAGYLDSMVSRRDASSTVHRFRKGLGPSSIDCRGMAVDTR